jgi:methylenetetrahydrofolate reductase (NADPH)
MQNLRTYFEDKNKFTCGIELVSTRGTIYEKKALLTRDLAKELADDTNIDWISITDNAGGNPQLSPMVLGTPILYAGKEVIIHLSCKDLNRNGLESHAWQLASEGFNNILTITGDYPVTGFRGNSKPVFDLDSIGLLTLLNEMNQGLRVTLKRGNGEKKFLDKTNFYLGAVTTNFKLHENEIIPQYFKLKKKIEAGAGFIISQIGFDAFKYSELISYMRTHDMKDIPVIGNVFLMNDSLAKFFNKGRIPGVVVSDEFKNYCQNAARPPDKGEAFFLEFAAKQVAIFKGLGYNGVYFGGIEHAADLRKILEIVKQFSPDDWKIFAKEIQFSRKNEFFYFAQDKSTGLADPNQLNPDYEKTFTNRTSRHNVSFNYKLNKWLHDQAFVPNTFIFKQGQKLYHKAKDPQQGPRFLRVVEHLSKSILFQCKDCGDCSLPDIAYLCPESSCVKNQRNGPCGGSRDGKCEIEDFECIWARAYDRLKSEGKEKSLLVHAPVIQDQSLRGTSSWGNTFRGVDHHGNKTPNELEKNKE